MIQMSTIPYILNLEAAIEHQGRYLLVTRGAGEEHAAGMLSLVGGQIAPQDEGDGIIEATLGREIREEVGVEVADFEYLGSTVFSTAKGERVVNLVFLCRYVSGDARAVDPDEVGAVHWLTADEARQFPDAPPWTLRYLVWAEGRRKTD